MSDDPSRLMPEFRTGDYGGPMDARLPRVAGGRAVSPQRIQRRRSKGWRMPEDAIYVGRPSRWGNPFAPILMGESGMWRITRSLPRVHQASASLVVLASHVHPTYDEALADAIHLYRRRIESWIEDEYDGDTPAAMAELRGHDLACWCALDQPCHADVLLELANRVEP